MPPNSPRSTSDSDPIGLPAKAGLRLLLLSEESFAIRLAYQLKQD